MSGSATCSGCARNTRAAANTNSSRRKPPSCTTGHAGQPNWRRTVNHHRLPMATHPKELPRTRYRMKGRGGFPTPTSTRTWPQPTTRRGKGDRTIAADRRIGAGSRPGAPSASQNSNSDETARRLSLPTLRCPRTPRGAPPWPVTTTAIDNLITLCRRCHQATHAGNQAPSGEPDAGKLARPVR